MVLVQARAAGVTGDRAGPTGRRPARPSSTTCSPTSSCGRGALDVGGAFDGHGQGGAQRRAAPAPSGYAISAVDVALWDLKARLLGLPLHRLLGAVRDDGAGVRQRRVHHLRRAAAGRAADRLGAAAAASPASRSRSASRGDRDAAATWPACAQARDVIGPDVELFVDANGGYGRKQADPGHGGGGGAGRALVRGAGVLRRPGRAARGARRRARRRHGRGVRL